jgi:Uma2 family endonuclease
LAVVPAAIINGMAVGDPSLKPRRWTRVEYERLIEQGMFGEDEHLELLDGLLVVREPQGSRHGAAVAALCEVLGRAFGAGFHVRPQLPVALDDTSEPEPDVVVVRGGPWDYVSAHPSTPVLVVEIAETSLAIDRRHKGGLYARAGIADYWIVNLLDTVLEVYREPAPSASAPSGWQYRSVQRLTRAASVRPLAGPSAPIAVADLLPPA